jgi:hypothetical protein
MTGPKLIVILYTSSEGTTNCVGYFLHILHGEWCTGGVYFSLKQLGQGSATTFPNTSTLIFGDVLLLPPTLPKAIREILALGPNYTQYLSF